MSVSFKVSSLFLEAHYNLTSKTRVVRLCFKSNYPCSNAVKKKRGHSFVFVNRLNRRESPSSTLVR